MVREISNDIAKALSKLSYTTIVGGWSRMLTKDGLSVPISKDVFKDGRPIRLEGDYHVMIPSMKDASIIYVKLSYLPISEDSAGMQMINGSGVVVFWGNTSKFKGSPQDALIKDLERLEGLEGFSCNVLISTTYVKELVSQNHYKTSKKIEFYDMFPYELFEIGFDIAGTYKCSPEPIKKDECKNC